MLVQSIGIDLTIASEVHGTDRIQDTRGMVACGIANLSTVTRIVEEIARSGLADKPVDCGLSQVN